MKIKLLKSKCYFDSNCRCFSSNWYSYPSFFKIQYLWKKGRKRLRGACGESGEPRFINENWAPFEDEDKGGTCGESEGHRFINGGWVHFPFDGDDKARKNKSGTPDPAKGNDHSLGENENSKDTESNDPSLEEDEDSKDTESNDPSLEEDEDSKDTESNDSDGTRITIPVYPSETPPHIAALWLLCEHCNHLNYKKLLKGQEHMCSHCEYHFPMASPERIEFLIDPGTWHPVDVDMASPDPDPSESDSKDQSESDSKDQSESDSKEQSESDSKEQSESDSKDKGSLVDKRLQKKILFFKSVIRKKIQKESCKSDSKEDLQSASKEDLQLDSKEDLQWDSEDKEEFDSEDKQGVDSEDKQGVELDSDSEDKEEFFSEDKQGVELDSDSKNKSYPDHLNSYRNKTGLNEAIQTGVGKINGIPAAFGIMEFEFMGGSMGSVVGEKITRLIEYAINQSLPLIIVCASGGARMQEGSVSLMQMGKISCTLLGYEVSKNKLIYISILASPTTGGVTASFGTLGDIILGEPNSYIAFAGKRVIEETLKQPIPEGSQEAEPLFEKGVLDQIIPRKLFKRIMAEFLKFHGFNPL